MEQEEIIEYNKLCAEFLNWQNINDKGFPEYIDSFGNLYKLKDMKFHSDWNLIISLVEAIEKLGYESLSGGSEYYYPERGMRYIQSFIKGDINIYQENKDKKEATIKAINKFLIWYLFC